MNKTESIRLARRAYAVIDTVAPRHAPRAYTAALEGERRHRRGDFHRWHPNAASAGTCAEMFVAKFTCEYLATATPEPNIRAVLYLRPDALISAAIAAEYADKLRAAFAEAGIDPATVAKLDYTTLAGAAVPPRD